MMISQCPVPGNDFGQPGMDAVFLVGEGLGLCIPDWYPASAVEAHFAQCLLRDPQDLACHARRINFWLDRDGATELAAALTDLFLVLGPREPRWQARLLGMANDRLPPELFVYLRRPVGEPPIDLPTALFAYGPAYPDGPDFSCQTAP